ncbi:MAG TPA: DUF2232 domain-containing protein [Gemmatimonadaceae bacterium]
MTQPAAADPARGSWRRLAVALAAFVLLPLVPGVMRIILPIEQTTLLLVAVVASCAVVSWKNGGRFFLALLWVAVAVVVLVSPAGPVDSPYNWLARGWTLLLAASFGLVSIVAPTESFFPRALSAIAVATSLGFALVLVSPGGPTRLSSSMNTEFARRNEQSLAYFRDVTSQPGWKTLAERSPALQTLTDDVADQLETTIKWSSVIVPALLALESLAALALGYALFNRMTTVPIGPPLGKLREFRFNDQLVWGVAVGASIYLLPAFAEGRNAGLNLLVFFGMLYMLRGMGIMAWVSRGPVMSFLLVALGLFLWFLILPLAFGLGLGDTWLDFRTRAQSNAR